MKKLFLAIFTAAVALSATAQNKQIDLQKGDSIKVKRECTTYLTGQKIPAWVYDVPMTVLQVGSTKYPDGILIKEVVSWVGMEAVGAKYVNGKEETVVEEPAPAPEPVVVAEPVPAPAPAPVVEEPAPIVVEEPEPMVEPAPVVEETKKPSKHLFGIALHAGVANLGQEVGDKATFDNFSNKMGIGYGIGFEYTYLFLNKEKYSLGLKTGVGLDFATNKVTADGFTTSYDIADDGEGNPMKYTLSAKEIEETNKQMMVEIPLMLSFRHKNGIVVNGGVKFGLPFNGKFDTDYKTPSVDAYYTKLDVHEIDQVITGKLTKAADIDDDKLTLPKFNLMFALEAGYSFKLCAGHSLDLLAYLDYPLYATDYDSDNAATAQMFYIAGPKPGGPAVQANSLMNSYGSKMNYLSAGLKVSFNF